MTFPVPAAGLLAIKIVMDMVSMAGGGGAMGAAKSGVSKAKNKGKSMLGGGGDDSGGMLGGVMGGGTAAAGGGGGGGSQQRSQSTRVVSNTADAPDPVPAMGPMPQARTMADLRSGGDVRQQYSLPNPDDQADNQSSAGGGGGGGPNPNNSDDVRLDMTTAAEYGGVIGTVGDMAGLSGLGTVSGTLAGAAIGKLNEKYDFESTLGNAVEGAKPQGKIGEGLSQIREAGSKAVDDEQNEYGELAKKGEVAGMTVGSAIPGVKADTFGKIGKAAGGADAVYDTFKKEGGTEGLNKVKSGVQAAGEQRVETATDRFSGVVQTGEDDNETEQVSRYSSNDRDLETETE